MHARSKQYPSDTVPVGADRTQRPGRAAHVAPTARQWQPEEAHPAYLPGGAGVKSDLLRRVRTVCGCCGPRRQCRGRRRCGAAEAAPLSANRQLRSGRAHPSRTGFRIRALFAAVTCSCRGRSQPVWPPLAGRRCRIATDHDGCSHRPFAAIRHASTLRAGSSPGPATASPGTVHRMKAVGLGVAQAPNPHGFDIPTSSRLPSRNSRIDPHPAPRTQQRAATTGRPLLCRSI